MSRRWAKPLVLYVAPLLLLLCGVVALAVPGSNPGAQTVALGLAAIELVLLALYVGATEKQAEAASEAVATAESQLCETRKQTSAMLGQLAQVIEQTEAVRAQAQSAEASVEAMHEQMAIMREEVEHTRRAYLCSAWLRAADVWGRTQEARTWFQGVAVHGAKEVRRVAEQARSRA